MKWLVAEAPAVIVSRSTLPITPRLIRFEETSRNREKNFQMQSLAVSSDDLTAPSPNGCLTLFYSVQDPCSPI